MAEEKEPERKYFTVHDTNGNLVPIKLYYND